MTKTTAASINQSKKNGTQSVNNNFKNSFGMSSKSIGRKAGSAVGKMTKPNSIVNKS
jgi:hypothetical protein